MVRITTKFLVALTVVTAASFALSRADNLTVSAQSPASVGLDPSLLATYQWRSIGPDRGGRSLAVAGAVGRLGAADLVRMLSLLADAEASIRRSATARLVVETLLLKWTLMDRVVDLEAVIAGMPAGRSAAPPGNLPPVARPIAPSSALSLPALLAEWPAILVAARERKPLLGEALAAATPSAVEKGAVRLTAGADHAVLVEGLKRQLGAVEELLAARFTGPIKVSVVIEDPSRASGERPQRITGEGLRAERLERLRRLDPALDTAADELDLEIVDEG